MSDMGNRHDHYEGRGRLAVFASRGCLVIWRSLKSGAENYCVQPSRGCLVIEQDLKGGSEIHGSDGKGVSA